MCTCENLQNDSHDMFSRRTQRNKCAERAKQAQDKGEKIMRKNKANNERKILGNVARVIMLVMLFTIVFAGTLSGAFAFENLADNGLNIEGNIADAGSTRSMTVNTVGSYTDISKSTAKGSGTLWHGSGDTAASNVNILFSTAMQNLINRGLVYASFVGNYGQNGGSDQYRFGIWGGTGKNSDGTGEPDIANMASDSKYYQMPSGALTGSGTYASYSSNDAALTFTTGSIQLKYTQLNVTAWAEDKGWFSTIDSGLYNVNLTITVDSSKAFTGSGTSASPFILATREDFDVLSALCQVLGTSYDTTGKYYKVQPSSGTSIAFGSTEFIPIGGIKYDNTVDTGYAFKGILVGNSCTISGITVTKSTSYNGLFGVTNGATISNLTISSPAISGSGTSRGAFIGRADGNTTLTSCTVSGGSITGTYQVGGLVGYSSSTITFTSCKNTNTSITATSATSSSTRAGGFLGSGAAKITIAGTSTNSGSVKSTAGTDSGGVGGFVGYSANNVEISGNITNSGTIGNSTSLSMCTGGIVGWLAGSISIDASATIKNSGAITGVSAVGGCFGLVVGGSILRCQNTGTVSALGPYKTWMSINGAHVGGIIGHFRGTSISNCYSSGNVTTGSSWTNSDLVGGIAGYSNGTINYCYAQGTISGSNQVGGIVGHRIGTLNYCYFNGTVSGFWNNSGANAGYLSGNDTSANSGIQNCLILEKAAVNTAQTSIPYRLTQDQKVSTNSSSAASIYAAYKSSAGSWTFTTSWTSILSNNIEGVRASSSLANGYFLQINSPTEIGTDDLPGSNTTIGATTTTFTSYVFFSANRDSDVDVEEGTLEIENLKITYGENSSPSIVWPVMTRSEFYETESPTSPIWYFNGTAYDGTVFSNAGSAPSLAGIYTATVEVCINGVVMGRKSSITYEVERVVLEMNPDSVSSQYTYNGEEQGVTSLTADNIVSGESLSDIISVSATNCTFSFENNVYTISGAKDVGEYSLQIVLTGSAVSANYALSISSYEWEITPVIVNFIPGAVNPSYIYNGTEQGVTSLTADNIVSGESLSDIISVSATNCTSVLANDVYTISGAKDVGEYSLQIVLTGSDVSANYALSADSTVDSIVYSWSIVKRELEIVMTYTSSSSSVYIYNAAHQGLSNVTVSNIADSGKTANDIIELRTSWGDKQYTFASNVYTFNNTINAGTYYIEIDVLDGNYSLPTLSQTNWEIAPCPVTLTPAWTTGWTSENETGYDYTYVYNKNVQGLTGISVNNVQKINHTTQIINLSFSTDGTFASDPILVGINISMQTVNSYSYSVTVSLKDNALSKNYVLQKDNADADAITYSWTINPKVVSVEDFYYNGTVANNGNPVSGKGYPLNLTQSDYLTKPALAYQDANYVFDNFKVYDSVETLSLSAPAENSVGANAFYAVYNGANVSSIEDIKLSSDDTHAQAIALKFISLDPNYKFDEDKDSVYYSLLISDFGVLAGKIRDNSWGSEENPYVISSTEYLLRLSAIVNGGESWDSISIGFAEDRHYEGCYFVATQDLSAKTESGFVPVGGHNATGGENDNNWFSGTFGGATLNDDGTDVQRDGGNSILFNNKITINTNIDLLISFEGYAGVFGYVKGARIAGLIVDSRGGFIRGIQYVGGVVGYADGGIVENVSVLTGSDSQSGVQGSNYIGGIVGYANGTSILQLAYDDDGNIIADTDFFAGRVYSGNSYVGGIAGYWIVTDRNQVNNGYDLAYGAQNVEIAGNTFVGGIAGCFDASNCVNGLALTATLKSNPTVSGRSFVGGLYGMFTGSGYKKTSAIYDAGKDSTIELNSDNVAISVKLTGSGNAVGGVFGYVMGVGLIFTSEGSQSTSTTTPVTLNGYTPNFIGVISGVIGENATIENPSDSTDGNYYDVYIGANLSGGDFVGSIAGYVSSNAGVYYGNTGTLFGNRIILVSNGTTSGKNYVGGIFGAIGKITNYSVSDSNTTAAALLNSALQTTGSSSVLTFGPRVYDWNDSTQPWGRVANLQSVSATGNYVGGIVGGVFSNARLVFENPVYDTELSNPDAPYSNTNATYRHTPIFNGNKGASGETSLITISGVYYVGGIAGYLGDGAHSLKYVVSRATVGSTSSRYVGGLVGEMHGGVIANSMSVIPSSASAFSATTDIYRGAQYVGGIVGNVADGRVENCISTGMKFTNYANTKSQVGGVAGEVGQNATVKSSWAIYIATNPTYSSTPTSGHGKYILIDDKVDYIPTYTEIAKTIGLYTYDLPNSGLNASSVSCGTKTGFISIGAMVPLNSNTNFNNQQLVFYDASGADVAIDNSFDAFENLNNVIRMRVAVTGEGEQESFSVCIKEIEFVDIAPYSGSDAAGQKSNAEKGYRAPSNGKRYSAEVTEATYNGTSNNISALEANAMFTPSTGSAAVKIGEYSKTFTTGSSETPFIIASQKDWDDFAYSIYSGTRNYSGMTVKLVTDGIVIRSATSHNGNSFASNGNYNFAGLLSIGGNSTLTSAEQSKVFKGTFDGGGHTITVSFSSTSYPRASVFPNSMNATFKNLTIAGTINAGTSSSSSTYDIAGFVAKPFGALTFENCTNAANITALRNAGGLVGYVGSGHKMTFIGCVNTGNITTHEGSYSLAGRNNATYSYDDGWGNGVGYQYGTGGIAGTVYGSLTIESCRNAGNIVGGHNVGGIIGRFDGTASSSIATLNVYSCANTGSVLANSGYTQANINARGDDFKEADQGGVDGGSSRGVRKNIFGYAGGIVGKTGQYAILNMFYSYNSANVMTYANIAGGLVGGIGSMYQPSGEKNSVATGGKSTVAYCYNTGEVRTGGNFPKHIDYWAAGRENYGGVIGGGIAGLVGNVLITNCYNAGDIYSSGIVAYGGSWQFRSGGIVGQSQPVSGGEVKFSYLYNIGTIGCRARDSQFVAAWASNNLRYGGSISGYCDTTDAATRIKSEYVYSIKYPVSKKFAPGDTSDSDCQNKGEAMCVDEKRGDWLYDGGVLNIGAANEALVVAGQTYDTFEQLTALMNSSAEIKPTASGLNLTQSTASLTSNISTTNIPSGWIYVYGCLPQLAVFALDTQNGLSMRSVGYGKNQYGDYVQGKAGSEEYPFIIKDGIDLLGMSALSNLGYNFSGKYIEFANKDNNLESMQSKIINMPTLTSTTTNLASYNAYKSINGSTYQTGKSYHLFSLGALCNTAYNSDGSKRAISDEYTKWVSNNYRFTGSSTALSTSSGTAIGTVNFYPIGINSTANIFAGSLSGEQSDGTNTTVRALRIKMTSASSAQVYAGLFGRTQNAKISYITVSGSIETYANGTNRIAVGGIVGFAGGSTVVEHCQSGETSYAMNIKARRIGSATSYAGGIAGIVSNELYTSAYTFKAGSHTVISNSSTTNATVSASTEFIGGIAGYAGATKTGTSTGMSGSFVEITDCKVNSTYLEDISGTTVSDVRHIGGVIGTSDQYIALTVSGCSVGNASTVSVKGSYALGGIMGSVSGSTRIENCAVGTYTTINRANGGTNAAYATAIGGLVGYTKDTAGSDKVLTLDGNISFAGKITIGSTAIVKNVGGIVGYMGSGSRFQSGSVVDVSGTITITVSTTISRSNIGGVAGLTKDVSFSGSFSVSPTMSLSSAENVGGFIGENLGNCSVLSDSTVITIDGTIGGKTNIGGFIGDNAANANLIIAPDSYDGISYIASDDTLNITISANISATADNVGGLVGLNAEGNGSISLTKGVLDIQSSAIVKSTAGNNVGGIIGNNSKALNTGGSASSIPLQIVNAGTVSGVNNVGGIIGLFKQGVVSGEFTNLGTVSGTSYVGGSIGYMDTSATIDATSSKTLFVNGDKTAYSASDEAMVASDYATTSANSGSVVATGDFAGGSIGGMHGTIQGSSESTAVFENYGDVNANNYVGGSIGMLTGTVKYAVFVNDAGMSLAGNAKYTVGGSIGYVGDPNAESEAVSITNTHFEFNGTLDISAGETDTGNENGIGGAIGVIKQADEWADNTFYVSGSINAPNLNNVGGVVGLILEDNIEIRNMLAYYTSVKGNENVGGIVGATHGANTVIDNAFNVEGEVVGVTAGGIIGLAQTDTDAATSYWVKSVMNSELEKVNISNLKANLGKLGSITLDGAAMSASTSSPISYFNERFVASDANSITQTEEIDQGDGTTVERTTITDSMTVTVARDDSEYSVTLKRVTVKYLDITTSYSYVYNGSSTELTEVFVDENGAESGNDSWKDILAVLGVAYIESNGFYVYEKTDKDSYTTGEKNTGWYFVYADTSVDKTLGEINTLHGGSEHSVNNEINLAFWKRIANAYSAAEKAGGESDPGLSQITSDGSVEQGTVYANATKGKSGYYLYIAASNKDVLPKMSEKDDGSFFISVLANAGDPSLCAQNIAIYYKTLEIDGNVIYNGYDRYTPVKNTELVYGEQSTGYYYTDSMPSQKPHDAGNYSDQVVVWFKSEGKNMIVGGIDVAEWKIKSKEVEVINSTLNGIYGNTNNITTITAKGIAATDSVGFVLSVSIDGAKWYIKTGTSETDFYVSKDGTTWEAGLNYQIMSGVRFVSANVSTDTVNYSNNDKKFSFNDYANGSYWNKLDLKIEFNRVKKYTLDFNYDKEVAGDENYTIKSKVNRVNVEPKELKVIIDKNNTGCAYDGLYHGTTWTISGWEYGENFDTKFEDDTYQTLFNLTVVKMMSNTSQTVSDGTVSWGKTGNNSTVTCLNMFKDVGNYALEFEGVVQSGENRWVIGNYYFVRSDNNSTNGALDTDKKSSLFTVGTVEILITGWADTPSAHEYDQKAGNITVEMQVQDGNGNVQPISNYIDIINSYYSVTMSPSPAQNFLAKAKDETTAVATFTTGVSAGRYTATLALNSSVSSSDRANCKPDETNLSGSHIITKRTVTIDFVMSGSSPYVYDTNHHGLNSVTIGNVLTGDNVSVTVYIANAVWSVSKIGYKSGVSLGVTTSDASVYTATVSSMSNTNYQLPQGINISWTIKQKALTMTIDGNTQSATYDGTEKNPNLSMTDGANSYHNNYYNDYLDFNYKLDGADAVLINAGVYNLTCDTSDFTVLRDGNTVGDNGIDLINNYDVSGGAQYLTYTINKAVLQLEWTNDTLTYNRSAQGQELSTARSGNTTFTVIGGNTVNAFEGDVITFTLTGKGTNAGVYTMHATSASLTNSNRTDSTIANYSITGADWQYTIEKAVVSIGGVTGIQTTKVYDATTDVVGTPSIIWNGTVKPNGSEYTVTAVYNDKNVAFAEKIIYTVSDINANFVCEDNAGEVAASIIPCSLTVMLDKLRNSKATKSFDGTVYFGGEKGFVNGDISSQIYRSGEGFRVTGFPIAETYGVVSIVARYAESASDRTAFDSYVNNVVYESGVYSVNSNAGYFKKLVFAIGGEGADNYNFSVNNANTELASSVNGIATVYDQNDAANVGAGKNTSNISIEITVKSIRANYENTAQSYANADNTYNTNWIDVKANASVDGISVSVKNGWRYQNGVDGEAKTYDRYTVIRGSVGSSVLSAAIDNSVDGLHVNYSLSNQPILTIGYFIDSNEFEIGSMASLMIATYYQHIYANKDDPDFNTEIIGVSVWKLIVSESDYAKADSFETNKPSDAGDCASWDEYFALLETRGLYVFLNTSEGENSGWGYYTVDEENGAPKTYSEFRQISNISGVMTDSDIAILDSFFTVYKYNSDGTVISTPKEWGFGGEYITNFVKVGTGSTVTAIGSIFSDEFGTGCVYDGNGYTINYVNIVSYGGIANVGMFANVTSGGSVKNVHLRNFSIVVNGGGNVGGIIGLSSMSATLENCSFHGSITANGNGATLNVGGIIGSGNTNIDGAIVMGNIDMTNSVSSNAGGVSGRAYNAIYENIVSMVEIYANGNVGAIAGNPDNGIGIIDVFYLKNAVWTKDLVASSGNLGEAKTYSELYSGSNSGYINHNYYASDQRTGTGVYDMLDNVVKIDVDISKSARESMRLRDMIDVYLLMYSLIESNANILSTENVGYYSMSATSWLVGDKHGTNTDDDAIVIANQQGVALLRELRFASFKLVADVEMYSTHSHSVYDGVFYGSVNANGCFIYLQGTATQMFEKDVNANGVNAIPIKTE